MKLRIVSLVTMVVALCTFAAWAQMPEIPSFSADLKITTTKGESMTGKIYYGAKHSRMEMNAHGQAMIMISDYSDMNNVKVRMLMPSQHMYMEMNSSMAAGMAGRQRTPQVHMYDPTNPCSAAQGETCKQVGVETMNGYVCSKWEFSGKSNMTVWISQKLHFPIKSVQQDGTTVEFNNISESAQDSNLFEVPSDYRKMDLSGMMGGRQPQQ